MFNYVVDIYRKGSISDRQDSSSGRLSSGETLVYENVSVELQPYRSAFERDGIRVEAKSIMFCGKPLDIVIDDIVVTSGGDRYRVIENRQIASSYQWFVRKVA